MSDSVRPHRRQPTRLPRPWDSPGNTGVGCHFLLQCMKVKSEREVSQSCPTLCNPTDCSPPGSSVHGIFQARVLAIAVIIWLDFCFYSCHPISLGASFLKLKIDHFTLLLFSNFSKIQRKKNKKIKKIMVHSKYSYTHPLDLTVIILLYLLLFIIKSKQ